MNDDRHDLAWFDAYQRAEGITPEPGDAEDQGNVAHVDLAAILAGIDPPDHDPDPFGLHALDAILAAVDEDLARNPPPKTSEQIDAEQFERDLRELFAWVDDHDPQEGDR